MEQIASCIRNPICKRCLLEQDQSYPGFTKREQNTFLQWAKLKSIFQLLDSKSINTTDIILRIRPDVDIQMSPRDFAEILKQYSGSSSLYIPKGNDIFHKDYQVYAPESINDQVVFGSYAQMHQYCSLYNTLNFETISNPVISEALLYAHLKSHQVHIERIPLPYSLCLSQCQMIAITGDSGAGKTTLLTALKDIFPYDSNLVFETDRYHKWARGDSNWTSMTHLHPDANYLEKMEDDTYCLKLGNDIQQVDYDHKTGKFTAPQPIESKPYVFLCGLHTMFKENLRTMLDLKLFIYTEKSLKRFWKIRRDMKKRGYTFQQCDEIFQKRQADYETFILPQRAHADLCICYYADSIIPTQFDEITKEPSIVLKIECKKEELRSLFLSFLESLENLGLYKTESEYTFISEANLTKDCLQSAMPNHFATFINYDQLKPGYLGVLQCIMLLILFKPYQP
jgi:uridine kinase